MFVVCISTVGNVGGLYNVYVWSVYLGIITTVDNVCGLYNVYVLSAYI